MEKEFSQIKISTDQAAEILNDLYDIKGEVSPLDGFLDFNFKVKAGAKKYILKISRPGTDKKYLEFQNQLFSYLSKSEVSDQTPAAIPDKNGEFLSEIIDGNGDIRLVRLLSWMDGRLWSSVNPIKDALLFNLGERSALLTKALTGFEHPFGKQQFDWDTARADWTYKHLDLFNGEQRRIIQYFQKKFMEIQGPYKILRKSIVHNDVNDNNVVVSGDLVNPEVTAIIDYGDATHTQIINDLAIAIAYAVMRKPDPLTTSLNIVKGYNSQFPLKDEELKLLYVLVAIRLVLIVIHAAINRKKEPDNVYLWISEKPAWELLEKWMKIEPNFAYYSFRNACDLEPHPKEKNFLEWADSQSLTLMELFPGLKFKSIKPVDIGVSSTWLGLESEFTNSDLFSLKINRLQYENPNTLIAGGYLENRAVYGTENYKKEGNNGSEYRSVHLGIDFWVEQETAIHAPLDGKVISLYDNGNNKDYGPTLILEHKTDEGLIFYSLYGHLSRSSLKLLNIGQYVKKNELIAYVGNLSENGDWASHLHFQLILDRLGNKVDFPGVTFPDQTTVWKSICPDPNIFFKEEKLIIDKDKSADELMDFREKHLGKGLSLSYNHPINIVRGSGVYLIDKSGRRFLDTVNNVAHVGHEHPEVVKAGQGQMGVLNTNTRYLHENINKFAEELLATFPEELSVVHFVNSGSEAVELALRMARTNTGQKDMIAVEVGYHGNSNGCIEVSSYKFEGKGGKGSPEHTHIVPLPDRFRGLYQGENCGPEYASHVDQQIEYIKSKERGLAGFICESIISCGGQIELPEGYLKNAYKSVRAAGGLCIADEVQIGVGRVGKYFWGFQLHDVIPDIVTIGKPIGNGHPVAAVVCTKKVAIGFANGMEYFNTFGGNPVSCAIGHEVLNVVKNEKLQDNALSTGNYLKSKLNEMQKEFSIIGDVRGQGLFLGFELVDEHKKPLKEKVAYLANRMRELGVFMSIDGRDNNVLKIKPPIVFNKDNADELLLRLNTVFNEDFMRG